MKDKQFNSLSLIIPVYHEGYDVYPVLKKFQEFLSRTFNDFEIIIALDGDDADTNSAIEKFKQECEQAKTHHSSKRRGKGGAILDSFSIAKFELTAISDADTSIAAPELGRLVESLERDNADVAIGSRYIKGSRRRIPVSRLILSRFFNVFVRIFTGLSFNDTQCGTKILSSKFLPSLVQFQNQVGWAFDVQMLYILKSLGAKMIEVPVDWVFAEGSRMKLQRDVPQMFLSVVKSRFLGNKRN